MEEIRDQASLVRAAVVFPTFKTQDSLPHLSVSHAKLLVLHEYLLFLWSISVYRLNCALSSNIDK